MPIVRLTVVGFPGGSTVKNLPAKQDTRVASLGGVDPLEEGTTSCLENPVDRGDWRATAHGVTKSQTGLSNYAGMR